MSPGYQPSRNNSRVEGRSLAPISELEKSVYIESEFAQ